MTINNSHSPVARPGEGGFTLVELMVATAIALLILVGVSGMFVWSSSSEKTNSSASEISTNGRYAIEVLRRDLMHAGYRGITWSAPSAITTAIGAISNECLGSGFATNLRQGVWGSNDSNPFSATCISATSYSTGDVLVIRHAALAASTSLAANTLYFRSAYERGEVFKGTAAPAAFTQLPRFDYALETKVFYISPFANSATETPRIPALYRVSLGAGPTMAGELVASNVEDMQIQYGRATTDLNTQFYDANDVSASATALTTGTSEWDDVSVVRIWILVRATAAEPGYTNTSTYTLGDKAITVNDGFRREVFSTVVQLRNI